MKIAEQFFRFLAVGGAATALHYLILVALVQLELAGPVAASSIGFTISAAFNYALNRLLTFKSDASHVSALPKFALVAGTGLILNGAIIWLLLATGMVHYLVAQVFATGVTLVWNFALNRLWTFRTSIQSTNTPEGCSK